MSPCSTFPLHREQASINRYIANKQVGTLSTSCIVYHCIIMDNEIRTLEIDKTEVFYASSLYGLYNGKAITKTIMSHPILANVFWIQEEVMTMVII